MCNCSLALDSGAGGVVLGWWLQPSPVSSDWALGVCSLLLGAVAMVPSQGWEPCVRTECLQWNPEWICLVISSELNTVPEKMVSVNFSYFDSLPIHPPNFGIRALAHTIMYSLYKCTYILMHVGVWIHVYCTHIPVYSCLMIFSPLFTYHICFGQVRFAGDGVGAGVSYALEILSEIFIFLTDIAVLLEQILESTVGAQQQTPFGPLLQGFPSLPCLRSSSPHCEEAVNTGNEGGG